MEYQDYSNENYSYQLALNKVYGTDKVIPLEKYINPRASLLHYCHGCKKEFFQKPSLAIREDHKHICGATWPLASGKRRPEKEKKKLTSGEIEQVLKLGRQGKSVSEVARTLGLKPSQVRYRYKKEGII